MQQLCSDSIFFLAVIVSSIKKRTDCRHPHVFLGFPGLFFLKLPIFATVSKWRSLHWYDCDSSHPSGTRSPGDQKHCENRLLRYLRLSLMNALVLNTRETRAEVFQRIRKGAYSRLKSYIYEMKGLSIRNRVKNDVIESPLEKVSLS